MKRWITIELVTLALLFAGLHCGRDGGNGSSNGAAAPSGTAADTVQMPIGSKTFTLEIADSPEEHQHGLMARDSMPADHGMIFVFPEEEPREFWMKDTLIPLDIIYLDSLGRVVSVKSMAPRDLTPIPSGGPAMYAIELNKGAATDAGVHRGDALAIPAEIGKRQKK